MASDPTKGRSPPDPIVNNVFFLTIQVENHGTNAATNAAFAIYRTGNTRLGPNVTVTIARGETEGVTSGEERNTDFALPNSFAALPVDVKTQPELSVSQRVPTPSPFPG